MTKTQFLKFEKACKDMWAWLAENPTRTKPIKMFDKYIHGCPACEVSHDVYGDKACTYCPVDKWRKRAIRGSDMPVCVKHEYGIWEKYTYSDGERMRAALKISKLKWTFLPHHKEYTTKGIDKD